MSAPGSQRGAPPRLSEALRLAKRLAKRTARSLGPERMVQAAIELLRAAEPTYSQKTLALLLEDVIARSDVARQAELCQAVLLHWREGAAFAPYALRCFEVLEQNLSKLELQLGPGFEVCELGPGDSLCLASLIAAKGASYVGVDPWPPVLTPALYEDAARFFREETGLDVSSVLDMSSDPIRYSASIRREVSSLSLADASADFVFSIAVLEHVRDPQSMLAEGWRLLRPGGVALHSIDYEDHRGRGPAAWEFLRLSTSEWDRLHEGDKARDYTNRVRHSKWLALIEELGFEVVQVEVGRGTPPSDLRVHPDLLPFAEGDLEIQGAHFVLRKPAV